MNAQGERFFVKFHWIPELGVHSLVWDEALKIAGQDPGESEFTHYESACDLTPLDFHRKDLEEAVTAGEVLPRPSSHPRDTGERLRLRHP